MSIKLKLFYIEQTAEYFGFIFAFMITRFYDFFII